jgi:mannose-6-phosphate isomerase-like protein (cupin superfamily)
VGPRPGFPGGTSLSGLSVYRQAAPDGLCGGSPHVHLACTEAYVVVGGEGELHTLTAEGPVRTELRAGVVVWFGPGTIHRAVNRDGELRVVVLMDNSALPESGDAVLTFPPEILADPEAYQHAASARDEPDALRRRDLAVTGYLRLEQAVRTEGTAPLEAFYRSAVALRADRFEAWESVWRTGALAAAQRTAGYLAELRQGWIGHLLGAGIGLETAGAPEARAFGMCGRLERYPVHDR